MSETPGSLHPATLGVLASTPAALRGLLASLPASAVETPGAEGWSPKDVVAHMLSIESQALKGRVLLIIDGDDPAIPNIDEDATLGASGMRDWPLAKLLDEFGARRSAALQSLSVLDAEELARHGKHGAAGAVSAADVVHHVAFHDLLHIGQITQLICVPIEERRGAMRMFR
jgi:uncharacterized damage-inducible protein DinB